jgi:hypothetical protein
MNRLINDPAAPSEGSAANPTSAQRFAQRKIRTIMRDDRPLCGARTRTGKPCRAQALRNKHGEPGRCRIHGGLSTGPKTPEGRAIISQLARQMMQERWVRYRAENNGCTPLSEEGRERLRQGSSREMRRRHRRREAIMWSERLMAESTDPRLSYLPHARREIILRPYKWALETGGLLRMQELAAVADIGLSNLPDGAELTGIIAARYAPGFNIERAAEDLRRGAAAYVNPNTRARMRHGVSTDGGR